MRIYIDTSVVGGFYDEEFEKVEDGDVVLVVSDLLRAEIERSPPNVRSHLNRYPKKRIEYVELTKEARELAGQYIAGNVVGKTSMADCQHIAIATLNKVDVLVSWNFKHIVNLARIRGYNSVNMKFGYPILEIRTPKEVLS